MKFHWQIPLSFLILAGGANAQPNWIKVSGDGERLIAAETIRGNLEKTIVFYQARYQSTTATYDSHVQVDCQARTRLERNRPGVAFPLDFGSLSSALAEEVDFACRWVRDDADVMQIVSAARYATASSPRASAAPQSPVPSNPAAPPPAAAKTPALRPNAPKVQALGSGFLVTTRQVVTNAHVVDGCGSVVVKQDTEVRAAESVAAHEATDLAVLTLGAPLGTAFPIRPTAVLGEEVMVAGHPLSGLLSSDIVVTSGQVNSLSGLRNDPTTFQLSAGVHSGNSGGPVLDRTGAVVGVVVSKLNALRLGKVTGELPQNINFAVKAEVLRLFLDANRIRYQANVPSRKLDGAELALRARASTVQVACIK